MTETTRGARPPFDPDVLASMEEERRFLLRSIADLDAEHAAGDIGIDDYTTLRDDYTRRAAEAIRAVDEQRAVFASTPGVRGRQMVVWLVGLALLGGLSGALLARSSGARSDGDSITGGVRQSSISQLNRARGLFSDPEQWDEAIDIYDSVLEEDPSSAEARTYRAWLQYRGGAAPDAPLDEWADVRRGDPGYADAIVFTAIVQSDLGRWADAEDALESIDPDTAPTEVLALISQRGLDGEIYGEARFGAIEAAEQPALADLELTVDQAMAAAGYLVSREGSGGPVAAIKLYRAVRAVEPDHAAALSREALILASVGLADDARPLIDRAVAAHPDDAEALLTRATLLAAGTPAGDLVTACADLAALAGLDDVAPELIERATQLSVVASCG